MSNSSLVTYTNWTPNYSSRDGSTITVITPHHMAGNASIEAVGNIFARPERQASATYLIGSDGRIGQCVDEAYRPWTSGSYENDRKAVTIEVANDSGAPDWHVSDEALESLIKLCVDICQRNNIKALNYTGDTSGNLTKHCWFQATNCLPSDTTELLTPYGWRKLRDICVGDKVASARLDDMSISFEDVYYKIPEKEQDTYICNNLEATKDHRMVYRSQLNNNYIIDFYKNLLKRPGSSFIPTYGMLEETVRDSKFNINDNLLRFLVAVQADGYYEGYDKKNNDKSYFCLCFHFSKQRKIDRICDILNSLDFKYSKKQKGDGTYNIRVYNQDGIRIVEDVCEKYLNDKCFTMEWLNINQHQADILREELMLWDGCNVAHKYTSCKHQNLDVLQAVFATHNTNTYRKDNDLFFYPSNTTISCNMKVKRKYRTKVSCVSVKTGLILIRQNGRTFVVGNCPGPYLSSKFPYIAEEVNRRLNGGHPTPKPIVNNVDVIYSVYTDKWLDPVVNYNNSDYNGYAGWDGKPITGIRCNLSNGSIKYRAHIKGGNWLDWVVDKDPTQGGYAGIYGKPIDGIQMCLVNLPNYHVEYRTRLKNGEYLSWVNNYGEGDDGYSGWYGKELDRLQIRIIKDYDIEESEPAIADEPISTPVEEKPQGNQATESESSTYKSFDCLTLEEKIEEVKRYLAEYNANIQQSTYSIDPKADINGDGKISALDLIELEKQYALENPSVETDENSIKPETESTETITEPVENDSSSETDNKSIWVRLIKAIVNLFKTIFGKKKD